MNITAVRSALSGLMLSLIAASSAVATPTISSFSPASGTIGNTVIVSGSGFTGATAVNFNGAASSYTVNSDSKITAIVPDAASTGPISVTAAEITGTSATNFTVTPGMALSASSGPPTVKITVFGAGFHASTAVDLYFDNVDAALFVTTPAGTTSAVYQIPVTAQPGAHWITLVERGSNWAAQKLFMVQTLWPEEAFSPQGRGNNPYENTINSSNVGTLVEKWSGYAGGFANQSPFVVGGGGIFVADLTGVVRAYSTTGTLLWTASPGGGMQSVNPVVALGRVFVGDSAGNVHSYSQTCRSDGGVCTPQWTTSVGTTVTAGLTFFNGTLYAPSNDGSIHTLNPTTGVQGTAIYGFDTSHGPVTTPVTFEVDGSFFYGAGSVLEYHTTANSSSGNSTYGGTISPIAVYNGSAYFTTTDGMLHRFGSAIGWDVATSSGGCAAAPVIALGRVYAGGCTTLGAYLPNTGSLYWEITTGIIQGISQANGVIYVCEGPYSGGNIQAYDAGYGGYYWTGGSCNSAPEVTNGNVFAAFANLDVYDFSTVVGSVRKAPPISSLEPDLSLKPQPPGTEVMSHTE